MRGSTLWVLLGLIGLTCRSCDIPIGEPTTVVTTCAVDGDTELQAVVEEWAAGSVYSVAFDLKGQWLATGSGDAA